MTIRGLSNLERTLKKENRRQNTALKVAIRVEGYRLMRLLKEQIRKGAPGGRRFEPLSFIARKRMHRGRNTPLRRLAVTVRYHVLDWDPFTLAVGWTGPRVSQSMKAISKLLQTGFTRGMSTATRKQIIRTGAEMSKRAKGRRYHFLKKTTKRFKTPARPILEPFWIEQRRPAADNIRDNFRRKMRGERI